MQGTFQRDQLRYLTAAAFFAAMINVAIRFIHIPTGIGQEIVHVGDVLIYLAACFLPKKYALVAVAIGGASANLLMGFPIWAPATAIIKPLIAVWFINKGPILTKWHACALVIAGVINAGLYYVYGSIVVSGNWITHLPGITTNLFIQSGGSAVIFILLAATFDKTNLKKRLGLESA